jgi:hypothetical protein
MHTYSNEPPSTTHHASQLQALLHDVGAELLQAELSKATHEVANDGLRVRGKQMKKDGFIGM